LELAFLLAEILKENRDAIPQKIAAQS